MSYSTQTRHHIWYETAGETGTPVLLVMGFASRGAAWRAQVGPLARNHRVAWFDNAGIGSSGPVRTRALRMRHLADDALGVMEDLGWQDAHVVGVSMGGMVAQHIALKAPERVRSLTLTSTHPGGARHILPPMRGLLEFSRTYRGSRDERLDALARLLYSSEFRQAHPERVRELLLTDFRDPPPITTSLAQIGAIMAHNTHDRLAELGRHSTLILRPGRDVLVDARGSDVLATRIPGARLVHFEDAGHVIPRECPTRFNSLVLAHFAAADERTAGSAAHG